MARFTRVFSAITSDESGEFGWAPTWLTGVDESELFVGAGLIVAHDTIEHEAHENDGDLENETRALGAAYFVRGESGWFDSQKYARGVDEALANDFVALYRAYAYAGDSLGDNEPGEDAHDMRAHFTYVVRDGIRNAIAEHKQDSDERDSLARFAGARAWLVQLMCEGYAAAHERFEGKSWAARELFERISDASKEALGYAEDAQFGTLTIEVDPAAGKFHATFTQEEIPEWGDNLAE